MARMGCRALDFHFLREFGALTGGEMRGLYSVMRRKQAIAVMVAMLISTIAAADSVSLKTGEQLEGQITKDEPDAVTIEVQVSPGVTDERKIPRADIRGVSK